MRKKIASFLHHTKYALDLVIRTDKKKFFCIIMLSSMVGLFPTLLVWLNQSILNGIQEKSLPLENLIFIIILFFVVTAISKIIGGINAYLLNELNYTLMYRINQCVMQKCGKLSLEELEKPESYDQINRLEQGVAVKPYQVLQAMLAVAASLASLISASIIVVHQNAWVELLLLFISAIAAYGNIRVGNKEFAIHYERSETERKAWYISYLLTHDTYFKEVKENALSRFFIDKYKRYSSVFIKQENFIEKKRELLGVSISLFQDLISLILMIGISVSAYRGAMLIGTAVAFLSAVSIVQAATNDIARSIYSIYNATLYLELLKVFLNKDEERVCGKAISRISHLLLDNISFDYPSHKKAVKRITLNLHEGDQVAIVGKNGSGKSTLFKIIAGLYVPTQGRVVVNKEDNLTSFSIEQYRHKISALFQDYMKYEGTIEENIKLGDVKKDFSKEAAEKVLSMADVDFLKENGSYQFNQNIGSWFENGRQLSGGQWQKIALARVYYKDADVYMLDEPSASLDVIAESKVFQNFFQLTTNKIGVYITHRVRIAQKAPRIIVMDKGQIVADGNHEKLYNTCPLYRKMYEDENTK